MRLNAIYIAEDTAGHGGSLVFPRVSTCVAVVVRLPAELVGWHVTTGTLATIESNKNSAQGAAKFIEYAGAVQDTDELYIVGHVGNHDPGAVRDWVNRGLGVDMAAKAFDVASHSKAKPGGEYHIFFGHAGGGDPVISFKKSKKTTQGQLVGGDANAPQGLPDNLGRGYVPVHNRSSSLTVQNVHVLRKHFVNL
ncbi:hypothetical protein LDO26_06550 [Luteimonas sp. BDR2-5]|uniref:hypothetical protein n=1 Tax=Proluteimonas luteida TaxID=2878685 RepID=UPI001E31B256|nr:hypothetical protein [Luteimonas sp. BDR2-5]MCD9027863.1 hypothetical protein [Luteimonas sp. BDR2-5]